MVVSRGDLNDLAYISVRSGAVALLRINTTSQVYPYLMALSSSCRRDGVGGPTSLPAPCTGRMIYQITSNYED